jgi:hypothetical protein
MRTHVVSIVLIHPVRSTGCMRLYACFILYCAQDESEYLNGVCTPRQTGIGQTQAGIIIAPTLVFRDLLVRVLEERNWSEEPISRNECRLFFTTVYKTRGSVVTTVQLFGEKNAKKRPNVVVYRVP